MNDRAPSAASIAPTPRSARRWRRRLLIGGGVVFLLVLALLATAPFVAAPLLRDALEQALQDTLGADGTIGTVKVSYFGGVELGAGRFRSPDGRVELAWERARSDVRPAALAFTGERWNLGERLTVTGLRIHCDVSGAGPAGEPQVLPTTHLRLPSIELENAAITVIRGDERLELAGLSLKTSPCRMILAGPGGAASRLEEILEVELASRVGIFEGSSELHGDLALTSQLRPGPGAGIVGATATTRLSGIELRGRFDDGTAPDASPTPTETATTANEVSVAGGTLDCRLEQPSLELAALLETGVTELADGLRGSLEARLAGLRWGETDLETLLLDARLADGEARFEVPPTALNGGRVGGRGVFAVADGGWSADLTVENVLTSREVIYVLARICPVFVLAQRSPAQTRCRLDSAVGISGRLRSDVAFLDSVTGDGRLTVTDGEIQVPAELEPLLGLLSQEDLGRLTFEGFEQPFRIENGRVVNDGFRWTSREASLLVDGYTTVRGELSHRFRLDRVLSPSARDRPEIGPLLELLKNDPVRLEGTVSAPILRLPRLVERSGLFKGIFETGRDLLERRRDD